MKKQWKKKAINFSFLQATTEKTMKKKAINFLQATTEEFRKEWNVYTWVLIS